MKEKPALLSYVLDKEENRQEAVRLPRVRKDQIVNDEAMSELGVGTGNQYFPVLAHFLSPHFNTLGAYDDKVMLYSV